MKNIKTDENEFSQLKEFHRLWKTGMLTEENIVYKKVELVSKKACRQYGRSNRAMDTCRTCLIALAAEQPGNNLPIDARIRRILEEEVISVWRYEKQEELRTTSRSEINHASSRFIEEIFRKLNSEKYMRSQIASSPEMRRNIIEIIVASNCYGMPLQNKLVKTLKQDTLGTSLNRYGPARHAAKVPRTANKIRLLAFSIGSLFPLKSSVLL